MEGKYILGPDHEHQYAFDPLGPKQRQAIWNSHPPETFQEQNILYSFKDLPLYLSIHKIIETVLDSGINKISIFNSLTILIFVKKYCSHTNDLT